MSKRLYVGNLPFSMTDDQLRALFAAHGEVTNAQLITDKYSGRSRGFGFVEMVNDAEATAAIEKVNGQTVDERKLVVNEARPREERSDSPRRSFGNRNERNDRSDRKGFNRF